MRIQCPCCRERFDVPIRTVLAEAEKLASKNKSIPSITSPVNGNVLSPHDLAAKRERDAAVRRRLGNKNI